LPQQFEEGFNTLSTQSQVKTVCPERLPSSPQRSREVEMDPFAAATERDDAFLAACCEGAR